MMSNYFYFFLIPAVVYIYFVLRLINGIKTPQIEMSYAKRSASVILIGQDDQWAMHQTLFSLANQSYPADLYQVYIVSQHISDSVLEYIEEFVENKPNFHIIWFDKHKFLNQFLELNRGELILFLTGGAEVSRLWLETMAIQMDEDLDLLIGFSEPRFRNVTSNLVDNAYYGEVLFSSFVSAGALSMGRKFIFDTGNVAITTATLNRLLYYHHEFNSPHELRHILLKRAQKLQCNAKFSYMENSMIKSYLNASSEFFSKKRAWYSLISAEDKQENELLVFKLVTIVSKLIAFGHIGILIEYLFFKYGSEVFQVRELQFKSSRIKFYIIWLIIHPFIILYNIIVGLFSTEQKK